MKTTQILKACKNCLCNTCGNTVCKESVCYVCEMTYPIDRCKGFRGEE